MSITDRAARWLSRDLRRRGDDRPDEHADILTAVVCSAFLGEDDRAPWLEHAARALAELPEHDRRDFGRSCIAWALQIPADLPHVDQVVANIAILFPELQRGGGVA